MISRVRFGAIHHFSITYTPWTHNRDELKADVQQFAKKLSDAVQLPVEMTQTNLSYGVADEGSIINTYTLDTGENQSRLSRCIKILEPNAKDEMIFAFLGKNGLPNGVKHTSSVHLEQLARVYA